MNKNIKMLAGAFGYGFKSLLKAHWNFIKAYPIQAFVYYSGWCAVLGASIHLGKMYSSWLLGLGIYLTLSAIYSIAWYRTLYKLALKIANAVSTTFAPNR